MNKAYKLVWNKAKSCWVAASEMAKRNGKTSKKGVFCVVNGVRLTVSAALLCSSLVSPWMTKPVFAAMTWTKVAADTRVTGVSTSVSTSSSSGSKSYTVSGSESSGYSVNVSALPITSNSTATSNISTGTANTYYMGYDSDTNKLYLNTSQSTSGATVLQLKDKFENADDVVAALAGKDVNVKSLTATGALKGASSNVTGNSTVGGNQTVTGNETIGGTLGVTGKITGTSEELSGNLKAGSITTTGDETIGGKLTVNGDTNLKGELQTDEDAHFAKDVYVDGKLYVNSDDGMDVHGPLNVYGDTHLHQDLQVDGDTHLHDTYMEDSLFVFLLPYR